MHFSIQGFSLKNSYNSKECIASLSLLGNKIMQIQTNVDSHSVFLLYSEQSLYIMHNFQKYTKYAELRSISRRFLYFHFEYNNNEMKNTHISLIFRNLDPEQNSSSVKETHDSKINITWSSDKTICY
jgi:hypothetical protein